MDDNKVTENKEAINKAMEDAKFSKNYIKALKINHDDVVKMKTLTPILDKFEEGVTLLGGENIPQ